MPPRIPPRALRALRRFVERGLRGPQASEVVSDALREVAGSPAIGGMTSAEYADIALRQLEIPWGTEAASSARYAEGALDPKLSPLDRGRRIQEHEVPELGEEAKKFLPRDSIVPPKPPAPPRGEGPSPQPMFRDDGSGVPGLRGFIDAFAVPFGDPAFTLGMHPLSNEIYLSWRRARFDGALLRDEQTQRLAPLVELFQGLSRKQQKARSASYFRILNGIPGTESYEKAIASLSQKELNALASTRTFLEEFRDSDVGKTLLGDLVAKTRRDLGRGQRLTAKGRQVLNDQVTADFANRGLLEQLGLLVWKTRDFRYRGKAGAIKGGAFPHELANAPLSGNAALKHLIEGDVVREDILGPLEAITRGVIRRQIYEPAWREMSVAAREIPPSHQLYVRNWLKELKGVPSLAGELMDTVLGAAIRRAQTVIPFSAGQRLSTTILSSFYRGALFGNLNYYFANFFGQGFLNAAARHGPVAAFQGIARHFGHAVSEVPRESIMGGFEAIFGREVSTGGFAGELASLPGIKELRKFLRATDEFAGPTRSEFTNRSIGMQIGLKEGIDRYNAVNKTALTVEDVFRGRGIDDQARNNLLFDALLDAENVNYVYGVDGRNPILAQIFGRSFIAHSTQFLSWAPKTAEFLFGPILREGDFGILANYLLLSGWLGRQVGNVWGVDFGPSTIFGARWPRREFVPLPFGPSVQALWLLMAGITTEDEMEAKEIWREFGRTLELGVIPGDIQIRRSLNFWRNIQAEGLLTPSPYGPWELVHQWGPTAAEQPGPIFGPAGIGQPGGFPRTEALLARNLANILRSETPARVLGLPTLSDRHERRILTEIRRTASLWRKYVNDLTEAMLVTAQTKGFESPEFRQLVALVGAEGIPIEGPFREGLMRIALPRLQRALLDTPGFTRYQFLIYLRSQYPELFHEGYQPQFPIDSQRVEPGRVSGEEPSILEEEGVLTR